MREDERFWRSDELYLLLGTQNLGLGDGLP